MNRKTLKRGITIAEKTHETRMDRWDGNKSQIPILTLGLHKFQLHTALAVNVLLQKPSLSVPTRHGAST